MTSENRDLDREPFLEDINRFKKPGLYKEMYADERVQQLVQAMDILARLREESFGGSSRLPWEKLENARKYLDDILKNHLDQDKA